MNYTEIINENIKIDSDLDSLNKKFRNYLEQVFSPIFVKKIDRVFKKPLQIENFKEKTNVMAITDPEGKIYINLDMIKSLPDDRKMVYIIHELFHVLQKKPQFRELVQLNNLLGTRTLKFINEKDINEFLTGKKQDIHSNYKEEFLSYCSNFAFKWNLAPELKKIYFDTLSETGLFNLNSKWWKERFK